MYYVGLLGFFSLLLSFNRIGALAREVCIGLSAYISILTVTTTVGCFCQRWNPVQRQSRLVPARLSDRCPCNWDTAGTP